MKIKSFVIKNYKRIACLALVLLLVTQFTLPVNARYVMQGTASHIELTRTDDKNYSADIENGRIKIHMYDEDVTDESRIFVSLEKVEGDDYTELYFRDECFKNGIIDLSIDFSNLEDGEYILYMPQDYNLNGSIGIPIVVSGGKALFTSPNGGGEQSFLDEINKTVDPELCRGYSEWIEGTENYNEIATMAKSLTAGCSSDEEKVRVIHDWICENFAYTWAEPSWDASEVSWVYNNRRAVCSGFARLVSVMMAAVDVPTINVQGFGGVPNDYNKDYNNRGSNHEWNMIYYNGSWHIFDFTWDCRNAYYGSPIDYSNKPTYAYYDVSPFVFGMSHMSISNITTPGETPTPPKPPAPPVTDIVLSDNEKHVEVGESFALNLSVIPATAEAIINIDTSDESILSYLCAPDDDGYIFYGEGLKEGVTTITFSTKDGKFSDTCVVTVGNPADDPTDDPEPTPEPTPESEPTPSIDNVDSVDEESGTAVVNNAYTGGQDTVDIAIIQQSDIYRMYNPITAEHLYTKDAGEVEWLVGLGWNHEAESDYAVVDARDDDAVPVYRLYNPYTDTHHYTESVDEVKYDVSVGWIYERISHYVYDKNSTKGTPQWRLYHPSGPHNWTSDQGEISWLEEQGWINEGIRWRVI